MLVMTKVYMKHMFGIAGAKCNFNHFWAMLRTYFFLNQWTDQGPWPFYSYFSMQLSWDELEMCSAGRVASSDICLYGVVTGSRSGSFPLLQWCERARSCSRGSWV